MPDTDKILNDETAEAAPLEPEMVLIPAGEFMLVLLGNAGPEKGGQR